MNTTGNPKYIELMKIHRGFRYSLYKHEHAKPNMDLQTNKDTIMYAELHFDPAML